MKILFALLMLSTFSSSYATSAISNTETKYKCTKSEIDNIYIPILREIVDWPDDMIRPYAKQLCLLTKEKNALQVSINNRANTIRTSNWRVCKEVIPGNPNPTEAECKSAYNNKVNALIDQCISLLSLGHNPHNVGLILDPLQVEVSCLRGVNTALAPL